MLIDSAGNREMYLRESGKYVTIHTHKRINADRSGEPSAIGRRQPLGDKEIAVQIRGNSHYRN